jgi:hypothetical protein
MASPFIPFDTKYSAHTDVTIHPTTGVVTITVAFHPNNHGGYNCKIWELDPPYTGAPRAVRDWVQGQASVGPFGHGASVALPTGGVLTAVPVGFDSSSDVRPSILIDPDLGSPYQLGGGAQGPAGPPGPAGNGGIVLFSAPLIAPAWEKRTLSGGEWVDIPQLFGAPAAASYLVRFVAVAAAANVRVRAGTEQAPIFLTVNTQVAGLEVHTQGWVPGPRVWVSSVNGPAQTWLQILGMGI